MSMQQLLSSTSISTAPQPGTIFSIRDSAIGLAERGEGCRAVSLLGFAFFHSHHRTRTSQAKKSVLRAVWSAIEKDQQFRFEGNLSENFQLLADGYELEWKDGHQMGIIYSTGDVLHSEILAERDATLVIGRCDELVTSMCAKDGNITEAGIERLEQMLQLLCGE